MKPTADLVPGAVMDDARPAGDDDLEVDGAQIAQAFGIPAAFFIAEMRRGNVHATVERGIDADIGHYRLTFRYRGRSLRFHLPPDGALSLASPNDFCAPE
ncbi:DUF6522 family protein [Jiella pacifica]|uniref:Uncharacterized protein n=1 Tax=Jiella pacifica TaxID=2696469 RepID=A0A6N9T6X3_9HYPH|nr:DUF6522 family protein [Jiella pacifica]NDW07154.1 hypothetical protein [Jiella pacifica]